MIHHTGRSCIGCVACVGVCPDKGLELFSLQMLDWVVTYKPAGVVQFAYSHIATIQRFNPFSELLQWLAFFPDFMIWSNAACQSPGQQTSNVMKLNSKTLLTHQCNLRIVWSRQMKTSSATSAPMELITACQSALDKSHLTWQPADIHLGLAAGRATVPHYQSCPFVLSSIWWQHL